VCPLSLGALGAFKIQLPTWGYVSLAEVQVMGIDPVHFSEVDYSSAQNDFGGVNLH
jgi:hypothetical protein